MNCTRCGACCRAVNCDQLTAANLCAIYKDRPLICNVREGWKTHFSHMSYQDFCSANEQGCHALRGDENLLRLERYGYVRDWWRGKRYLSLYPTDRLLIDGLAKALTEP